MIPRPGYDDLFIYAPSMLMEGKALGTAAIADLSLVKNKLAVQDADLAAFANERKKGLTVGKRKLKLVQASTKGALLREIRRFQKGKLDEKQFRKAAVKAMKRAWRDVFLAGLRAGGTVGEGAGKGKPLVKLSTGDEKWLRSAVQHEMRFLNKFLEAIIEETYTMPLPHRTRMYVNALESFYNSARVIALPNNVLIYWTGPHDEKTCLSCEYMFDRSPFVTYNLATTPRSGLTLCLTNCRDRLLVRRVPPETVERKGTEVDFYAERARHIRNLRKIKRLGFL